MERSSSLLRRSNVQCGHLVRNTEEPLYMQVDVPSILHCVVQQQVSWKMTNMVEYIDVYVQGPIVLR